MSVALETTKVPPVSDVSVFSAGMEVGVAGGRNLDPPVVRDDLVDPIKVQGDVKEVGLAFRRGNECQAGPTTPAGQMPTFAVVL